MSVNRRGFLKLAGAGAAILAGGPGLMKSGAFAAVPARAAATSNVSFVGSSASGTQPTS